MVTGLNTKNYCSELGTVCLHGPLSYESEWLFEVYLVSFLIPYKARMQKEWKKVQEKLDHSSDQAIEVA